MAETFPTLSVDPLTLTEEAAYDPSIRSQTEDGLVISRRRFTGNKKRFKIKYRNMPNADKVLLSALQDTVGVGADTFDWTNPEPNDSTTYEVRFEKPIKFVVNPTDYTIWNAEFVLVEQ